MKSPKDLLGNLIRMVAVGVLVAAIVGPLLAIRFYTWDTVTDRFADFASWPGHKAEGGLVQLLILVAICLTLVGIIFLYLQVRSAERTRHSEVMLGLGERWDSDFLLKSRRRINDLGRRRVAAILQLGSNAFELEDYYLAVGVGSFFEDVGAAVKKGWIREREADDKFGPSVEFYYRFYQSYIQANADPRVFEFFGALRKRIWLLRNRGKIWRRRFRELTRKLRIA